MRTSITPEGTFRYGLHQPSYRVTNLRKQTKIAPLGKTEAQSAVDNARNYPQGDLNVTMADWIYEIPNPFPFRGTTYIGKRWADRAAEDYQAIRLPPPPAVSFSNFARDNGLAPTLIQELPRALLLSLATTSTDPKDLSQLAEASCRFITDRQGTVTGLAYTTDEHGQPQPQIIDHDLFEAVANNPALPDHYKIIMVIRPGAQGASEIIGDYHLGTSHVYEYLRKNSYIGGGHYAANMADDAIRYTIESLDRDDMSGLRFLYYQRTYVRLAEMLGLTVSIAEPSQSSLEALRKKIIAHPDFASVEVDATLWGWNFGFDFAPTGYRLHASHQQIHQQYALIPRQLTTLSTAQTKRQRTLRSFSCGMMIAECIEEYQTTYSQDFFADYVTAIQSNQRLDSRTDRPASLIIWEDDQVVLFVPKAQTSQWEVQLMTKQKSGFWPGNIIETDTETRQSIDQGLLLAQKCLARRGARLVTSIEFSKQLHKNIKNQPLIYSLTPKLPQSPGAFSETQYRFINGHYPEDFAAVCRQELATHPAD